MIENTQDSGYRPRISVIIPVFNGERYLADAIESVMSQTLQAAEIIAVNDGSTDDSARILDSYAGKVTHIFQANQGTASARNKGIDSSSGELLTFLDQDDVWSIDKLEKQVGVLTQWPGVQIIWGMVQQFVSPELPEEFRSSIRCPEQPAMGFLPSALLIPRESFLKIGYFCEKWKLGEWADWYARASNMNLPMHCISSVVVKRRIHLENKGIVMANMRKEYISVLRENLKRARPKT